MIQARGILQRRILPCVLAAGAAWVGVMLAHGSHAAPPARIATPPAPASHPSTMQAATAPTTATTRPSPRALDLRKLIGFDRLLAEYGRKTPIGRGIPTAHVEGDPGQYMPRVTSPKYDLVRVRGQSGPSQAFGHTTVTAGLIYGRGGLAPGIRDVHFYATSYWLLLYLRVGSGLPPVQDDRRLFNHSWIAKGGALSEETLRRVDYLADTGDKVFVVGVNNGAASPVPALLASAYNVIAVGQYNGGSSGGYTGGDNPGRCKPDLVAPGALTSYATAVVTAAAAGLLEAADHRDLPEARRLAVIRAVLLAGAEKPPNWKQRPGKALDEHFGAGRLRVDHSQAILRAGPIARSETTATDGWTFGSLNAGDQHEFHVQVPDGVAALSVVLTWNRRISGLMVEDLVTSQPYWQDTPRLANFDLSVRPERGSGPGADSASSIDNVEHVYLHEPAAGRYTLRVLRRDDGLEESWDYALAWRLETAPVPAADTGPSAQPRAVGTAPATEP